MKGENVIRDERTIAVENASYRLGYMVLSFGLLVIVAYRSLVRQDAGWDLLALVILGGAVTTFYQGIHRVLSQRWALAAVLTALLAAIVAAATVLLR
jgi:hypothetical protein